MPNNNKKPEYQSADKLIWSDKILADSVLKIIPLWIKPNHITVLRFILLPFVFLLLYFEYYITGLTFFILVSFTDMIDGAMARTRNQITTWGKLYDPVADKLLIGGTAIILITRFLNAWITIAVISIEFIILVLGWVRNNLGHKVQANWWGKIKLILQVLGIVLILLAAIINLPIFISAAFIIFYLAIFFAFISLITYGL